MLCAVARQGSLSAAAASLSYTPSAISQQITALEREVGVGLVERGAHGTLLTDAGRTLVMRADDIIGRLGAAQEEMHELVGLRAGALKLATFASAGANLVPRACKAFRDEHPSVDVSLCELEPDDAVVALHAREIDLAVVYEFPLAPGPALDGVEYVHLVDDVLCVALPRGHELAQRRRVKLCDLANELWIQGASRGQTLAVLPAACRASGFEPRIVIRSDNQLTVQGFVAAGLGVALIPQLTVSVARPDITIRALAGDLLTRRVGVAMPTGPYRPRAVQAMVRKLEAVARAGPEKAVGRLNGARTRTRTV